MAITWRVPLSDLEYGPEEEQAVMDVLRSGWLTMGEVTEQFERHFAEAIGVKHAVAVSNATVALHLACLSLDIGPGDEVIVPSLTFVASANAVLYTGAEVCFADIISSDELNIAPLEIKKLITSRTKAIVVVHYGGYPCQMPAIMDIARSNNLFVIEDAAHAPGATLDQKPLGTWGEIGCFSFFSNKNLAVGEGGMLVTNHDEIAERVRLLRSHGMTSLTWDRHQGYANSYDVIDLGFNYRIDEIRSALGLVQLKKLNLNNRHRKHISEQYRKLLSQDQIDGIEIPFQIVSGDPAYHIFPILLSEKIDRDAFMYSMRSEGIQTSIHYPPIHRFSYYQKINPNVFLPKSEDVAAREVTLPLYPSMDEEKIQLVVGTIKKTLHHAVC
jgi:dTDP-4-amino-4,6-dideoxygalactose transaminase